MPQPKLYAPSARMVWSLRQSGGNPAPVGFAAGTAPTLSASGNSTLASSTFKLPQSSPTTPTFPPASWASQGPSSGLGPGQPSPTSQGIPSTAIDLTDVTDVLLMVNVHGTPSGGTVTLNVALDVFDDYGNIYTNALELAMALITSGVGVAQGGLHAPGSANSPLTSEFLVLPRWGQVTWTVGAGSSWPGVDISLYGR